MAHGADDTVIRSFCLSSSLGTLTTKIVYLCKLFKIPQCMKENFKKNKYNDYKQALKITGYFFLKILENNKFKFIFRNQIINKLRVL